MTTETNDTLERYTISGNGPYAFSFRIFDETDLSVTALETGELDPIAFTYGVHYSVASVNDEDGGSITLLGTTATTYASYTLDIRSNVPREQPTSIKNQGSFAPQVHETAFDRLSRQIQDLYRQVRQSFRYPDNVDLDAKMTNRSSWASKYVYINSDGEIEPATSVGSTALTQSVIGETLYPRTAAEIAAGVTPVNYALVPGHVERYQEWVNSSTDMSVGVQAALSVCASHVMTATPNRTYRVNSDLVFPAANGLKVNLYGATIDSYSSGVGLAFTLLSGVYPTNCSIKGFSLVVRGGTGRIGFEVRTSYSYYESINVACASDAASAEAWRLVGDEALGSGPYYNIFNSCHGNGTASTQLACRLYGEAPGYRGPNTNTWIGGRWYVTGGTAIRILGAGNRFYGPTVEGGTVTAFDFVSPIATKCDGNLISGAYVESVTNAFVLDANCTNNKVSDGYYTGISTLWTDANGSNCMEITGFDKITPTGIKFTATSSDAGALDYYQEGNITPTATFATPGDVSVTYGGSNGGKYTRIGRTVIFDLDLHITSMTFTTASGDLRIGGLPFSPAVLSNLYVGFIGSTVSWTAGTTSVSGQTTASQTYCRVALSGTAANTSFVGTSNLTTGNALRVQLSGSYQV